MLDHECRVERAAGRTLVEVEVRNETAVDRRVRVENRLDGRVDPPRENGVPAPGWDADGFVGVVPAGDRVTLGYACPAPARDPPVAVHDEGRPDDETAEPTAADAVRALGDHAPPADAVPVGADDGPPAPVAAMAERVDGGGPDDEAATPDDETGPPVVPAPDEAGGSDKRASPDGGPTTPPVPEESAGSESDESGQTGPGSAEEPALPPAVAEWLDEVEGRVADAERVAEGLDGAAQVAAERGGAAEAAALTDALAADERALRALAARADRLADRAATAEVPAEALRALS